MRYKLLGRSGVRVSELCLGTMTFGEDWGWGASADECKKMVEAFAAAGGNFIDTANRYTNGSSERIVGELTRAEREKWVIATKYTLTSRPNDPNGGGNHRKSLHQSLDQSLRNLGTDYIDLYWVHIWDPMTPIDETMRALDDAVRAGKVLYVGISDTPAWVVSRANMLAELRGWTRFVGLQIPYSLIERTPERDLLPMARHDDMAVTTWAALGSGVLSGKYEKGKAPPEGTRLAAGPFFAGLLTDRNLEIASVVKDVARELDTTASQVALAWVLHQRKRAVIVPILGVRTLRQLEDNLAALKVELPAAALEKLEAASKIDLGFPHEFMARSKGFAYGETFPLIDDHRS
jgi:aryl-alcohol dehydrogenase-like predicted oxidoreductase